MSNHNILQLTLQAILESAPAVTPAAFPKPYPLRLMVCTTLTSTPQARASGHKHRPKPAPAIAERADNGAGKQLQHALNMHAL